MPLPVPSPPPQTKEALEEQPKGQKEPGFLVVCWNDPINIMAYVTHVFQVVFGWDRKRAEKHMLEVHEQGRSVLTRESFEKAEFYVHQLQKYSLQATLEKDDT